MCNRRSWGLAAIAQAVVFLFLLGCDNSPKSVVKGIVLISVDTLRADGLGCYGNDRPTSPALDGLAAQGVLFEDVWSTSPWTLPAHASLLTGLYPSRHGVNHPDNALPDKLETLQEHLTAKGFSTAAVVNSLYLGRKYGFHHGFSEFTRIPESSEPRGAAPEITSQAVNWLAQHADEKFFLFLHYYDVHSDYRPLPEYREQFVAPYDGLVDGSTAQLLQLRQGGTRLKPEDLEHLRSLYDAGIRQVDEQLKRLFDYLEEHGLAETTLVIVTSDHGEEFLEHGGLLHGRTQFQELVHIPLILRGPGLPAGLRVTTPASLVDVMPTILGMVDIDSMEVRDGVDQSARWLTDDNEVLVRQIYAEADHNNVEHDIKRAVRDGQFKLHFDRMTEQVQLYDLELDPVEQENLVHEMPKIAEALMADLQRFMTVETEGQVAEGLTEEEIERLKSLGYTQ